jgi:peptidyl-prolyl cis-trans isomerase A (cyclophilin A)
MILATVATLVLGLAPPPPEGAPAAPPAGEGKAPAAPAQAEKPYVILATDRGDIALELFPDEAPISVANFLEYVDSGFYNGTMFHRSMPNFVIQGGGFDAGFTQKTTRAPIRNEAGNGLKNTRGSISMARTNDPDTATCQFFLNLKDNRQLDRNDVSAGYAVFGHIVRGEDVMDAIARIPTTQKTATVLGGQHFLMSDVPTETVTIKTARRATRAEALGQSAPAAPATPAPGGADGKSSQPAAPAKPASGGATPPATAPTP